MESLAIARAAACPDLFVIHAQDPLVRERLIAELATVIAADRVLVLSPDPVAADRIVERLARADASVVRALSEEENPTRPLAITTRHTSAALASAHLENLRREFAAAVSEAEQKIASFEALASKSQKLSERMKAIDGSIAAVSQQQSQIEQDVRLEARSEEATAFTARLNSLRGEQRETLAVLASQHASVQALLLEKEALAADLRKHHCDASAPVRKTGFLSRLLGKHKAAPDATEHDRLLHDAEVEAHELSQRLAAMQSEIEAAGSKHSAELEAIIQSEVADRRASLNQRLAELQGERDRTHSEAASLDASVGDTWPDGNHSISLREAAAGELVSARMRLNALESSTRDVARRYLAGRSVVVGIPGSLESDILFSEESSSGPFGTLILDRAEELHEADFVRLAKLASRWILIGDAPLIDGHGSNGVPPRNGHARNGRFAEVPFVSRMARLLERERWVLEADRLVCRLWPPGLELARGLTREPLLDQPEIELRFASTTSGEPVLVEVAFPLDTRIAAAKSFLFRQLGEVLPRTCGEPVWDQDAATITAAWPAAVHAAATAEIAWIDLDTGIQEKVSGNGLGTFTAAFAFDVAAGWDLERARAWVADHLTVESPSRYLAMPRQ